MRHAIRRAAVIGSGTMGGGIAALLAGVGVPTLLLDIPAPDTQPGDPPALRNAIARKGMEAVQRARPPLLYSPDDLDLIATGNIDDDLQALAGVDWVIEAVVERLDIKRDLMARLAGAVGPQTIVSTNTSGLPLRAIAEGLPADFTRRFLGTHFFNPPRYLHLLELIPHPDTDPQIVAFMRDFAARRLGKGVVLCKDTPNFIGNRFLSIIGMQTINYALDHGYSVAEVDALTGPLIGRPRTATFNLNDLVGFDVLMHMARNLYDAIPDDPAREVIVHPATAALCQHMLDANRLGRKTDGGFYQMRRGPDGDRALWALNLATREYEPPAPVAFESVEAHRRIADVGERVRALIASDDRAGRFLWHHLAFYLAYASNRVPEIADTPQQIDQAMRWGFSHALGPFELWDALGAAETAPAFEAAGYPVAGWVSQMLAAGHAQFYRRGVDGQIDGVYDPARADYAPLDRDPLAITAGGLRATARGSIADNPGASIVDMGDGVALLELHTKHNTLDDDIIDMAHHALDLLAAGAFEALVVGSDGERFSIGLNLAGALADAEGGHMAALEARIARLQALVVRMRTAPRPVVTAPYQMALGGGAELSLGGVAAVAQAELAIGLVEFNVGVIPAGGGCKELLRRVVNPVMRSAPDADPQPHLLRIFGQLIAAEMSQNGFKAARALNYLDACDRVVMNPRHLLAEAKRTARYLAEAYVPARPEPIYAAGRDAYAALRVHIDGLREGGLASDYDAHIARELAFVLTGGAISTPEWVAETVILDLERAAFMRLMADARTRARIRHMLETNKPLRN